MVMLPSDSEFMQCRVFHKVLSTGRWQKLWSRRRREKLMPQAQPARAESASY